jgi:type IV secretory pathway TraG/TraD family ATPase VirD4
MQQPSNLNARVLVIMAGVLIALSIASIVALWIAGFVFFALAHHNPLQAGGFGYIDAFTDWSNGWLPGYGKRLAIAGVIGGGLAFIGPPVLIGVVRAQMAQRDLHGSARFATEAEIRRAGLL